MLGSSSSSMNRANNTNEKDLVGGVLPASRSRKEITDSEVGQQPRQSIWEQDSKSWENQLDFLQT